MVAVRSVRVFCGSSSGRGDAYAELAQQLGVLLAEQQVTLVVEESAAPR